MQRTPNQPKVTVLMGVRNGAAHLPAQLRSMVLQTHQPDMLIVSDDGSTDGSAEIISKFRKTAPFQVTLQRGPQRGFAQNYLALLSKMTAENSFIALADQDDVWLPEKLARAIHCLSPHDTQAALYCGSRWIWHPTRGIPVSSTKPRHNPNFRNALIENIAPGNTIVLNAAAARVAAKASQQINDIFAHDWWLYLLITGIGGNVIFDPGPPHILYRQHQGNQIGATNGLQQHIKRKNRVLRDDFANHICLNISALETVSDLLTPESKTLLSQFKSARRLRPLKRLSALKSLALHRQTRIGNIGFWGAATLGRI